MSEKKECIHCRRPIDAVARVCPYCNRDQEESRVKPKAAAVPLPPIETPVPPRESARAPLRDRWSTKALVIAAVVAMLMASFAIGGLVYALGKRGGTGNDDRERPPQVAENIGRPERDFPQLTLVADPTATIGQSITSAPIPDPDHKVPAEFQRSDATALPSSEYARLLEESRKAQAAEPASVDPRTVKTPAPEPATPTPRTEPPPPEPETRSERPESWREASRQPPEELEPQPEPRRRRETAERTAPVPVYQPLPRVKDREEEIEQSGSMRFRLTVDRDGSVKEIRVLETMPGMTGKTIAAIQRWKFKPATENGVPVEGTFMVDISFNAPQ